MTKRLFQSVIISALLAAPVAAQELPAVEEFGPRAGETVPDFSLVDQFGETRDLQSLMGPNGLMLVFSRSSDW